MTYAVKECFLTLQGEGVQAGRRAVFLRFAGCNLWSGREADRAAAQCNFCDTDFVGTDGPGGGKFADAAGLAAQVEDMWGEGTNNRLVVITGGEDFSDTHLIDCSTTGFRVARSNGTWCGPESTGCASAQGGTEWSSAAATSFGVAAGGNRSVDPRMEFAISGPAMMRRRVAASRRDRARESGHDGAELQAPRLAS